MPKTLPSTLKAWERPKVWVAVVDHFLDVVRVSVLPNVKVSFPSLRLLV